MWAKRFFLLEVLKYSTNLSICFISFSERSTLSGFRIFFNQQLFAIPHFLYNSSRCFGRTPARPLAKGRSLWASQRYLPQWDTMWKPAQWDQYSQLSRRIHACSAMSVNQLMYRSTPQWWANASQLCPSRTQLDTWALKVGLQWRMWHIPFAVYSCHTNFWCLTYLTFLWHFDNTVDGSSHKPSSLMSPGIGKRPGRT